MTNHRSSEITPLDLVKLAFCLTILGWAVLDWQAYSSTVNATVGAALVWFVATAVEFVVPRLGLDTLGQS